MPASRVRCLLAVVFVLLTIPSAFAASAEQVLYNFCSQPNCTDGSGPYLGNLVFDSAGNLYGTTEYGGADNVGVVFELSSNGQGWEETVLHSFANDGTDGNKPYSGVIFDKSGNLYGTTTVGGAHNDGTIFELSPGANATWTEKILHSFNDDGKDAAAPYAAPVFDSAGNLYGSSDAGGAHYVGAVYELMPGANGKWTEKTLHSFDDSGKDGWLALTPLIFDSSGNLYGTTLLGGSDDNGIVFELSPGANGKWTEKILHSFNSNGKDGYESYGGLTFNSAGNLFGTTVSGGKYGPGTVFELIPGSNGKWTEKILHNFITNPSDGSYPYGTVIFDSAGNLYGMTYAGGSGPGGPGTVYEMSVNDKGKWREKILYNFCTANNCIDGAYPYGGPVFSTAGSIFGYTSAGGANGDGVVFRVTR